MRHDLGFGNRSDANPSHDSRIYGFAVIGLHDWPDLHSGLLQRGIKNGARRGAWSAHDKVLPLQLLNPDRTAPRQRMASIRHNQNSMLVKEPAEEARKRLSAELVATFWTRS